MDQDNIFKLLLIVLLIGNNHGENCSSSTGTINDLILMALLLGFVSGGDNASNQLLQPTDTTF